MLFFQIAKEKRTVHPNLLAVDCVPFTNVLSITFLAMVSVLLIKHQLLLK
jgi:hypothetical protein